MSLAILSMCVIETLNKSQLAPHEKQAQQPLQLNKTKIRLEWMDPLPAPILKGDIVGKVYITIPGNDVLQENLISSQDVDKMSSFMRLKTILKFLYFHLKVMLI